LRVLLVDDNATNQALGVALLEKDGHTVETASNGKEALAALANGSFDVVFMDLQMPEMDGFEATARIRKPEEGTGKHIPIVAMTAHAMKGDRERCLESGMDSYISKPVRPEELYRVLASFAPSDISSRAMPAHQPTEDASVLERTNSVVDRPRSSLRAGLLDRAALLARVGGRDDRLRMIAQVFLDESSALMSELQHAIASGDVSKIKMSAHSLKGAVGFFGVPSVADAAFVLEALGESGDLTRAREAYSRLEEELSALKSALKLLL
jgi:CheY-like chemotaxis protein